MNLLVRLTQIPLDEVRDFDRAAFLAAGLSLARVGELNLVHEAYFGAGADAATTELARAAGVTVDMLAQIERSIRHVDRSRDRNAYRRHLIHTASTTATTCAALAKYAKTVVPDKGRAPRKKANFSASVDGLRTATITADERVMADLEATLRDGIRNDAPAAPQMAAAFEDLLREGGGAPRAVPRPMILVPAPQLSTLLRNRNGNGGDGNGSGGDGEGDDIVLGLTDGTTMPGKDFVNQYLAEEVPELEAALFHPTEGPVNHYRGRRLASDKQRTLAKAAQPICANPDCRMPADHCEIHHITPWKHGGQTNMKNLAPVCSYHNRVNDDDPRRRKRGRIEMREGRPVWVSPRGYVRENTRHRYGAMHTLFGAGAGR